MALLEQATIRLEARAGQTSEMVDFFHLHRRKAYHFALQLTGNPEDAMDLTQEAFLRACRDWNNPGRTRAPVPWLYTVLRNLAIDLLRKRAAHSECELDPLATHSSAPGPELLAIQSETAKRLWAAIAALPLAQREVLLLRDWHGLSYAEIAEVIGANVSLVNTRLHDARMSVRKRMRGFYGPDRLS